jgi:hypothetical protein
LSIGFTGLGSGLKSLHLGSIEDQNVRIVLVAGPSHGTVSRKRESRSGKDKDKENGKAKYDFHNVTSRVGMTNRLHC